MADYLPPIIAYLKIDIKHFAAGMGEAGVIAKKETGVASTAFAGMATVGKAALIGVAGAAAIGGVAVLHMAGDYEQATMRLVTSAGETHNNIEMVRQGMLKMAGDVGYSAMDLAKAMYIVESGGQHAADGLMVLRAAAEGAKTEGADLTTVADAVTSVLADYNLKAKDAALVTSRLVAAVGAGKSTFQELTGSLHSVLPIASAMKIPLEDILGALASMTVHGMSAEQATQNLAHTLEHLQKTTIPQQKELALLGISARQLADDLGTKGLTGTLQVIADAIRKNMGSDVAPVILQMQTALKGLPPAVQKLGAAVIDGSISMGEFSKASKGLNVEQASLAHQFASLMTSTHGIGSAQKSGKDLVQSYATALAAATGDATTLNVALMLTGENTDRTNAAVKTVAGATTEAGNHVKGWSDIQATFNQHLDRWKSGIEAAGISIGTVLLPYVQKAMNVLDAFIGYLSQHQDVLAMIAAAIAGPLVAAIIIYTAAMIPAAIATLAVTWPILAVIAAVMLLSAAAVWLWNNWAPFRVGMTALWQAVSAIITRVAAFIYAYVVIWLTQLHGWWRIHGKQVMDLVDFMWTVISAEFRVATAVIGAFFRIWFGVLVDAVSLAFHVIADIIRLAWDIITGIINIALDLLSGNWKQAWTDLKNMVHNVMGDISQLISDYVGGIVQLGRDFIGNFIAGIKSMAGALGDAVHSVLLDAVGGRGSVGANALKAMGIPGFARGGYYQAGSFAVVGERGPELFASGKSGQIISNTDLTNLLSQAGAGTGNAAPDMEDTNSLLQSLYMLLDERLPRPNRVGFSTRAYTAI